VGWPRQKEADHLSFQKEETRLFKNRLGGSMGVEGGGGRVALGRIGGVVVGHVSM